MSVQSIAARKLVPLAGYSKPLLKLDWFAQKKIYGVKLALKACNVRLASLQRELGVPGQTSGAISELRQQIANEIEKINNLNNSLRNEKISAYARQLEL